MLVFSILTSDIFLHAAPQAGSGGTDERARAPQRRKRGSAKAPPAAPTLSEQQEVLSLILGVSPHLSPLTAWLEAPYGDDPPLKIAEDMVEVTQRGLLIPSLTGLAPQRMHRTQACSWGRCAYCSTEFQSIARTPLVAKSRLSPWLYNAGAGAWVSCKVCMPGCRIV